MTKPASPLDHLRAYHGPGTPLAQVKALRDALEELTAERIADARAVGGQWVTIAEQLGINRMTASTKYRDSP